MSRLTVALVALSVACTPPSPPSNARGLELETHDGGTRAAGPIPDAGPPATSSSQGKQWHLFFGVNHYPRLPAVNQLSGASEDARMLADAFYAKDGALLRDRSSRTVLLDESATRERILGAVSRTVTEAKPGDTMIVFAAMHGVFQFGDYYLLPTDADEHNILGTGIGFGSLTTAFVTAAEAGVNVLFIFDACHSGGAVVDVRQLYGHGSSIRGSVGALMASSADELAYESTVEGTSHGMFTYQLALGLGGAADANKDSVVTLRELFDFAYANVKHNTSDLQNPSLVGNLSGTTVLVDRRPPRDGGI